MRDSILIDSGSGQKISAVFKQPEDAAALTAEDDKTLVLMLHDFPGHKSGNNELFADLEYRLGQRGHHTLRFDFRGCGESDGHQENFTLGSACEDVQAVKYWAKQRGYTSFAFLAEGLGATVATMNIDRTVRMLMLFWPVLDLKQYGHTVFQAKQAQEQNPNSRYIEIDGQKISTHLINEMFKIDLHYVLKEMAMPIMVFHGVQDQKIPIEQLDLIRDHTPARRIEITSFQDGGEGLPKLNHRKAIFYQAQQFVEKYG